MDWDAIRGQMAYSGAALQGNLPAYMVATTDANKATADMTEKRRQAMLEDLRGTLIRLKAGDVGGANALLQDRIEVLGKLGGDPSDTANILRLVQEGRVDEAVSGLQQIDDQAVALGKLPSMAGKVISAKDGQAVVQGPDGSVSAMPISGWDAELAAKSGSGATIYSASDKVMDNGTVIRTTRDGNIRVFAPSGEEVTGEKRVEILQKARREEVLFAGDRSGAAEAGKLGAQLDLKPVVERAVAEEKAAGEGTAARIQEVIQQGVESSRAMPILNRTRALLDVVETGGWNAVRTNLETWLGVSGANDVELSSSMGKAVLSQLRETFGSAFTEAEGDKLAFIEANFGKSTQGNIRLINQLIKMGEMKAEKGYEAALRSGDNESAQYILDMMNFTLDDSDPQERASQQGRDRSQAKLMEDASGNKAYVYPDGTIEEIR